MRPDPDLRAIRSARPNHPVAPILVGGASVAGHAILLAAVLAGPWQAPQPLPFEAMEVTAVSSLDYARAVAAGMEPVAAAAVAVTQRTRAVGGATAQGMVPVDRATGVTEPADRAAGALPADAVASSEATTRTPERPDGTPFETAATPVVPSPTRSAAVAATGRATPAAPDIVVEARPEAPRSPEIAEAPRPPGRSENLMEDPAPDPEPEREAPRAPAPEVAEATPPAADGDSELRARRGTATGEAQGVAAQTGQAASRQPSAAAASYPASVMQRLARTRRDRVRSGGTAVIAFTVAGNGGLGSLGVAQTSGVAEVDQAGLALVQRAAPFPPPPSGAQTSFTFQFTGE